MSRAVLTIVTWSKCGVCIQFERNGNKKAVIDHFSKNSDVEVKVIQLQGDGENLNEIQKSYPGMVKYLKVYPSLFLVTKNSWDNQSKQPVKLAAYKLKLDDNYDMVTTNVNGRVRIVPESGFSLDSNAIINWVNEQLQNNILFKTQTPNPNPTSKPVVKSNPVRSNPVPKASTNVSSASVNKPKVASNTNWNTNNKSRALPNFMNGNAGTFGDSNSNYRVIIVENGVTRVSEQISEPIAKKLIDIAKNHNE